MTRKKMILIGLLFMTVSNVNADIDAEKAKLALIVHELETITPLIAEAETLANKSDRIQFQYAWLSRDIERIKSAILEHINTPRIQPRKFPPIDNKYRLVQHLFWTDEQGNKKVLLNQKLKSISTHQSKIGAALDRKRD